MSCEQFWKPIGHFTPRTRVALARQLATSIDDLLEAVLTGPLLLVPGEWLSTRYVKACRMLEHLLDQEQLVEARAAWRRPFESLLILDGESDIQWDYGGRQGLSGFRGLLEELYVGLGAEPVTDETVGAVLAEIEAGRSIYIEKKRNEEAEWLRRVKRSAAKQHPGGAQAPIHEKQPLGFHVARHSGD